jgi:cation transporter-like permease
MRRLVPILVVVCFGVILGLMAWAFFATRDLGPWTGGSSAILIMILAGAVLTGALTGGLMALAFYSDRRGYDEPVQFSGLDDAQGDQPSSRQGQGR